MKSHDHQPVILGMHADDTLNVFVRIDGAVHQAARIMTHNGVDPGAMAAIMADLSDTFGWEGIAASVGGSTTPRALPRGGGAAAAALPTAAVPANHPSQRKLQGRSTTYKPRRKRHEMAALRDEVVAMLSDIGKAHAIKTVEVRDALRDTHPLDATPIEDHTTLRLLGNLYMDGRIGRVDTIVNNYGKPSFRWYAKGVTGK